jgi:thiol-disulfide isomerase/thioredoxin
MKKIIICLALLISQQAVTQTTGIRFFKGTFDEATALAIEQNKKIFIDFYTEWCGPCLTMALNIFPLPEVGEVYNRDFVNLKIDAEKGEGVELAKRYGVRSYPSYVFVDPATGEAIHKSGSNKSAERFLYDARCGANPQLGSVSMERQYTAGGYVASFLMDYILMKDASMSRDVPKFFGELLEMGRTLAEPDVWNLYVKTINGHDNPFMREVTGNYDRYIALHGKDAVDAKLMSATSYAPVSVLQSLSNFVGREHNMRVREISDVLSRKQYAEAYRMLEHLQTDPDVDQHKLTEQIIFSVRIRPGRTEDELSFDDVLHKFRLLRYAVYNMYDREDAFLHFNYAQGMEYIILRSQREGKPLSADLLAPPTIGKKEYDIRHPDLKVKPTQ